MILSYISLIHKEPESCYGVHFPDFPGIIEAADTLEEARQKAETLLALCIEVWSGDGLELPEPSTLDNIMSDSDNSDGVACLVSIQSPKPRSVRINMTIDETLLSAVDAAAAKIGTTRSGFIATAARAQLEHPDSKES